MHLASDLTISLLGDCPTVMKVYVYSQTYAQTSIAALIVIASNWKHPKYPLTAERIHNMWSTHEKELHLVITVRRATDSTLFCERMVFKNICWVIRTRHQRCTVFYYISIDFLNRQKAYLVVGIRFLFGWACWLQRGFVHWWKSLIHGLGMGIT